MTKRKRVLFKSIPIGLFIFGGIGGLIGYKLNCILIGVSMGSMLGLTMGLIFILSSKEYDND